MCEGGRGIWAGGAAAGQAARNVCGHRRNSEGQTAESFKTPETRICYRDQRKQGLSADEAAAKSPNPLLVVFTLNCHVA